MQIQSQKYFLCTLYHRIIFYKDFDSLYMRSVCWALRTSGSLIWTYNLLYVYYCGVTIISYHINFWRRLLYYTMHMESTINTIAWSNFTMHDLCYVTVLLKILFCSHCTMLNQMWSGMFHYTVYIPRNLTKFNSDKAIVFIDFYMY